MSQFLARVLDQLSVTAWMPSSVTVAVLLFMAANNGERSLGGIFNFLTHLGWGALIAICMAIGGAAMFTQAFQFEPIRLLEGYWPTRWGAGGLTARFTRRQEAIRRRLERELARRRWEALESLTDDLEREGVDFEVVAVTLDATYDGELSLGEDVASQTPDSAAIRRAEKWAPRFRGSVSAAHLRRIDRAAQLLEDYPPGWGDLLPTRLGNTIRAAETHATLTPGERLENYLLHRLEDAPYEIARACRDHRRQLDLYCSLVFACLLLGFCAAAQTTYLLGHPGARISLVLAISLFAASVVSYRAAVHSGRRMGWALKAIEEHGTAGPSAPDAGG